MTAHRNQNQHYRVDANSLIWGVILLGVATIGLVRSFGVAINWQVVQVAAPLVLIALGALGLVINRHQSRQDPS
ncbi:hypothetical protein ACQB6R_10740 [Propionibacteriaceae bacterium G1746]|uniref:hypothetical protein n=1 Tax=Aestuariimicrobium sp. G57 TaxID=3418485 RepID=UPI003C13F0B1